MNTISLCSCILCKRVISPKGIHTHYDRTHLKLTQYSSGHNGKYQTKSFRKNLSTARKAAIDKKNGKKRSYTVVCHRCEINFSVIEREFLFPKKSQYFCSRQCANSRIISDEHRRKTSESLSGRDYTPPRTIESQCEYCQTSFEQIKHYTKRQKRFCSRSCSTKHQAKSRYKLVREKRSEFVNYRADAAFKFNLKDYPEEFDFRLVEQYGWYRPKNRGNNLNGVSRDHMVSVRHGFDNFIDPAIISHPANCRLILQKDNASKNKKNEITYEELLSRIEKWNEKYPS